MEPERSTARLLVALVLVSSHLVLGVRLGIAQAATFTVTKTVDTNDGSCDADCSLREAIIAANANEGPDIIVLSVGTYVLTIPGRDEEAAATGDLNITDDVEIHGAGQAATIIDANGIDRVFEVQSPPYPHPLVMPSVALSNLTVSGGNTGESYWGGGIFNSYGIVTITNSTVSKNSADWGGGIDNRDGTVTLTSSTVTGNTANSYSGGGIDNDGTMIIADSTVSENSAGSGGGIENFFGTLTIINSTVSKNSGGGILNGATVTITNSTVSENSADIGGGIWSAYGTMAVTNSIVTGNTGHDLDGGIHNTSGTMTITNSVVSSNFAYSRGGGIGNDGTMIVANSTVAGNTTNALGDGGGIYNGGGLTITNSTISGNSAGSAGGIFHSSFTTLTVTNSTVSANSAADSYVSQGGGIFILHGTLIMTNSTMSGNSATDGGGGIYNSLECSASLAKTLIQGDCEGEGVFNSGGGNLETPGNTCGLTDPADQVNVADPLIGPLAENGGPTETHALLAGSPAIDKALGANCPATDQRGYPRPYGSACDIGAYEYGATPLWWSDSTDVGGGWRWSRWIGFFNVNSDPWIYHQQLDWMYASGTSASDLWIYYPKMAAWLWTADTAFPWLYRATGPSPSWLYYLEWTTGPAWFHNQTTDVWEAY